MFTNYLTTALRAIRRNQIYSAINVIGLALGFASCLLIALYVHDETRYDKFFTDADRIYRVVMNIKTRENAPIGFATTAGTLADALRSYSQVKEVAQIVKPMEPTTTIETSNGKKLDETSFVWADASLFRVLSFTMTEGNAASALAEPMSLVVTQTAARKYFGAESAMGKTLTINTKAYRVTGIIADPEGSSHFQPAVIASLAEHRAQPWMKNWHTTVAYTYCKLRSASDAEAFGASIAHIADKYVGKEIQSFSQSYTYILQPLHSIHLASNLRYELSAGGSQSAVTIFAAVAALVLCIACVNFINLATARASQRAKEVGVRKALGASRGQLFLQFMGESFLVGMIAFALGLLIAEMMLPVFNILADKHYHLGMFFQPENLLLIAAIGLGASIGAGVYPALVLSGFQPIAVLRGRLTGQNGALGGQHLRRGLVVVQFSISIILIVATLVVAGQLRFVRSHELGFDKNQMLVLKSSGSKEFQKNVATLCKELMQITDVQSASVSSSVPGRKTGNNLIVLSTDPTKSVDMRTLSVDERFFTTYSLPILAGRALTAQDSAGAVINEAALPYFGWKTPQDALGKEFGGGWGRVVGVIKDFHLTSLQTRIEPLNIGYTPSWFSYCTVKLRSSDLPRALAAVEAAWKRVYPGQPFDYSFLDQDFDHLYRSEERLQNIFQYFAGIAIAISCLGIFGLAAFMAERRTKEIAVRKVLGASAFDITVLLGSEFVVLVSIAFLIACPVGYFMMNKWLQDFAYRTVIGVEIFLVAGIAALCAAFITILWQTLKAAKARPVEGLRYE